MKTKTCKERKHFSQTPGVLTGNIIKMSYSQIFLSILSKYT